MKKVLIVLGILFLIAVGIIVYKNWDKLFKKDDKANTGNNTGGPKPDPCETCMRQYKDLGLDYEQQLFICHGNGNCTS